MKKQDTVSDIQQPHSDSQTPPRAMTFREIAHHIAVMVVRQHCQIKTEGAKKEG